jgi:hypothetical protein
MQGWGAMPGSGAPPSPAQDQWDPQQLRGVMGQGNYQPAAPEVPDYVRQGTANYQAANAPPPPPGAPPMQDYARMQERMRGPDEALRRPPLGVPDYVAQGTANYQAANAAQQGAQGPQPGVTVPQPQRVRQLPSQGFGRPLW